jgi:HD superfamily phosphohydrolase
MIRKKMNRRLFEDLEERIPVSPQEQPFDVEPPYSFSQLEQRALEDVLNHKFRRPLFVIGSGVSVPSGVPRMQTVFCYLAHRLSRTDVTGNDHKEQQIIVECRNFADQIVAGQAYRSLAAKLFGELQDSHVPALRKVWSDFCLSFLSGKQYGLDEREPLSLPLADVTPSDAHKAIANFYMISSSVCLSFNFDGLTHQAIQEELGVSANSRVFILDDRTKVRNFYGRKPESRGEYAVFKIRGDIFYAVCNTSGCPFANRVVPVYELKKSTVAVDRESVEKVLECPECNSKRSLRISFPGLEEKERETYDMIEELWRFVIPTVSGILVLGLSGVWDELAIHSLLHASEILHIPIFDVKRDNSHSHDPDLSYICRIQRELFPACHFFRVDSTANSFMAALMNLSSTISTPGGAPKATHFEHRLFPADLFWSDASHYVLSFNEDERRAPIVIPESSANLAYQIANDATVQRLSRYSQLGLKNYWWGYKVFAKHNRYQHSLGTARVSACWYKSLVPSLKLTGASGESLEREEQFVTIAALLHDFGHLPFSHLFEDIFRDIHWSSDASRSDYTHADAGRKKIRDLFCKVIVDGDASSYSDRLRELQYGVDDLCHLIDGMTGVPYLDAIINSPLDADKIDYIFRDAQTLSLGTALMPAKVWLAEFLADQDVSPEGFIRLNRRSALRALELLQARLTLYRDFYLSPWIRTMESIAARIINHYCILYTSQELMRKLRDNQLRDPSPDWGPDKIELAANKIEVEYTRILDREQEKVAYNPTLEKPLLEFFVEELRSEDFGKAIDPEYKEFLKRLSSILDEFSGDGMEGGSQLRKVYQRLHLAGPFRISRELQPKLREIIRGIELTFPDKILFCISAMPRVLSSADARKFTPPSMRRVVGENILVPHENPRLWTMDSEARIPLHRCNFKSLELDYVEVVLLDPWEGERIAGRYLRDLFVRKCRDKGIELNEEPLA